MLHDTLLFNASNNILESLKCAADLSCPNRKLCMLSFNDSPMISECFSELRMKSISMNRLDCTLGILIDQKWLSSFFL